MEVCTAFAIKEETYKNLMLRGQQMLARCPRSVETNIDQDITNLKEKWESVKSKLNEKKTKLEEAAKPNRAQESLGLKSQSSEPRKQGVDSGQNARKAAMERELWRLPEHGASLCLSSVPTCMRVNY